MARLQRKLALQFLNQALASPYNVVVTAAIGRIHRVKFWPMRAALCSWVAGFAATLPFWAADQIGVSGCCPTDSLTYVFMGSMAGLPAFVGSLVGRYYLPYALAFVAIYHQQLGEMARGSSLTYTDVGLGIMALLMGGATMSALSHRCRLRTNPDDSGTY